MPKIIEGLRDSILQTARIMLLEGGYDALTIRGVAKACGVAVGTVYNYFPGKETLVASVILVDWLYVLDQMRAAAAEADALEQGLKSMFDALVSFSDTYSPSWASYHTTHGDMEALRARHGLLVEQLVQVLGMLCARLGYTKDSVCQTLAAEALLSRSQQRTDFASLAPALEKLLA